MKGIRKVVQKLSREQMSVVCSGGAGGSGAYEPVQKHSRPRYFGWLNNSVLGIHHPIMDIQNSIMEIDISIMNILISIMNSHNPVMDIYIFIMHTHYFHDDVIKWKHFPRYWPFVRAIHRSPVNSPHKGQWSGTLIFHLICAPISALVNNREAGDLRRYRAHSDVIVMIMEKYVCRCNSLICINGYIGCN